MAAIFYIMGKSATGKDTVYRRIRQDYPELTPLVLYTTRPMRGGETDGVEYHFIDEMQLAAFENAGKIIEKRTYQTVAGPWHYATIDDGTVDPADPGRYYIAIGTLEAYGQLRRYFGENVMIPIYLYAADLTRLERAIGREKQQKAPNYREVCRRFLADEEDFSAEHLRAAGIEAPGRNEGAADGAPGYELEDIDVCYPQVCGLIDRVMGRAQS